MKTTELKAYNREDLGKKGTKTLREEGKIPAVIYDNGSAKHICLDYKLTKPFVFTPDTYIINLDVEGEKYDTIIREVQYHPTKDTIEHIELVRIATDKEVILTLPVRLVGTPTGVVKGGRLLTKLRKLKVRGVPSELPESVEIDVSELELGGTIKVGESKIEGIDVITSPTSAVASVEIPRSVRSAQAGTEAAAEAAPTEGAE